jgi:hypothetical protein
MMGTEQDLRFAGALTASGHSIFEAVVLTSRRVVL